MRRNGEGNAFSCELKQYGSTSGRAHQVFIDHAPLPSESTSNNYPRAPTIENVCLLRALATHKHDAVAANILTPSPIAGRHSSLLIERCGLRSTPGGR